MSIPVLTIVHCLPGRVRLHFSIPPVKMKDIEKQLMADTSIRELNYSGVSHTCVIQYQEQNIELVQVLKRLAIALADEYQRQPIFIRPRDYYHFTPLTQASALSIVLATINRLIQGNSLSYMLLGWSAVWITAVAVIEHAYKEIKRTGRFDPEALSVVYLFNSAGRGQLLRGALFTWLASFSRHLLRVPYLEGLKMEVVEGFDETNQIKYLDVVTSGSMSLSGWNGRRIEPTWIQ